MKACGHGLPRREADPVLEFTDTRMAEQYMDLYRRLMGKGTE